MAEIKLQRKSSGIWLWVVLGGLATVLLVWVTAGTDNPAERDAQPAIQTPDASLAAAEPGARGTVGASLPPAQVAAFITFVEAPGSKVGVGHAYTADGIRSLAAALNAVVDEGGRAARGAMIDDQLAEFRQKADR